MKSLTAIQSARKAAQALAAVAYANRNTHPAESVELWDRAMDVVRNADKGEKLIKQFASLAAEVSQ
ncbi:hypothetical protein MRQ47_004456 [Salmonella enterica]|nr:hypothetical protein [Salmonella enterica]